MTTNNINKFVRGNASLKPWLLAKNTGEMVTSCVQNICKSMPNGLKNTEEPNVPELKLENMAPIRALRSQEQLSATNSVMTTRSLDSEDTQCTERFSDGLINYMVERNKDGLSIAKSKNLLRTPTYKIYTARRFGSSASSSSANILRRRIKKSHSRKRAPLLPPLPPLPPLTPKPSASLAPQVSVAKLDPLVPLAPLAPLALSSQSGQAQLQSDTSGNIATYLFRSFNSTSQVTPSAGALNYGLSPTVDKFLVPARNQQMENLVNKLPAAIKLSSTIQRDLMLVDSYVKERISLARRHDVKPVEKKNVDPMDGWHHPPPPDMFATRLNERGIAHAELAEQSRRLKHANRMKHYETNMRPTVTQSLTGRLSQPRLCETFDSALKEPLPRMVQHQQHKYLTQNAPMDRVPDSGRFTGDPDVLNESSSPTAQVVHSMSMCSGAPVSLIHQTHQQELPQGKITMVKPGKKADRFELPLPLPRDPKSLKSKTFNKTVQSVTCLTKDESNNQSLVPRSKSSVLLSSASTHFQKITTLQNKAHQVKVENKVPIKAEIVVQTKPENKINMKAESKSESKVQLKAESKILPESKIQPRAESTVQNKVPTRAVNKVASKTPSKASIKAPTKAASKAVSKAPNKASVKGPSKTLVKAPSKTLVKAPSKTLVKAPSKTLIKPPSKASITAPNKTANKEPTTTTPSKVARKEPCKTPIKAPSKALRKTAIKAPSMAPSVTPIKIKMKSQSKIQMNAQGNAQIKSENKAESMAKNKTEIKAQSKTEIKAQSMIEIKHQDKGSIKDKAEVKPYSGNVESKTEIKVESMVQKEAQNGGLSKVQSKVSETPRKSSIAASRQVSLSQSTIKVQQHSARLATPSPRTPMKLNKNINFATASASSPSIPTSKLVAITPKHVPPTSRPATPATPRSKSAAPTSRSATPICKPVTPTQKISQPRSKPGKTAQHVQSPPTPVTAPAVRQGPQATATATSTVVSQSAVSTAAVNANSTQSLPATYMSRFSRALYFHHESKF